MKSDIVIRENIEIRNYLSSDYQATLKIIKELSNTIDIALNERHWRKSSGLRQFKSNLKRETLVVEVKSTGEVIGMGVIEAQKDILGNYVGYLDNWIIKKEIKLTTIRQAFKSMSNPNWNSVNQGQLNIFLLATQKVG